MWQHKFLAGQILVGTNVDREETTLDKLEEIVCGKEGRRDGVCDLHAFNLAMLAKQA